MEERELGLDESSLQMRPFLKGTGRKMFMMRFAQLRRAPALSIAWCIVLFVPITIRGQDVRLDSMTRAIDLLTNEVLDKCLYECKVVFTRTGTVKDSKTEITYKIARSGEDLLVEAADVMAVKPPEGELKHQIAVIGGRQPVRIYYNSSKRKNTIGWVEGFPRMQAKNYARFALNGTCLDYVLASFAGTDVALKDLVTRQDSTIVGNGILFETDYGKMQLTLTTLDSVPLLKSVSLAQGRDDLFKTFSKQMLKEIRTDQHLLPGSKDGLVTSSIDLDLSYKRDDMAITLSGLVMKWKITNANGHVELLSDLRVTKYMRLNDTSEVGRMMVSVPDGTRARLLGEPSDFKVEAVWKGGSIVRIVDGNAIEVINAPVASGRTRLYVVLAAIAIISCIAALIVRYRKSPKATRT